jgi:hypothetical protein
LVQAGAVNFDIIAKESGCASVALVIFDQSGVFPLDHLVHTVDVRKPGERSHKCFGSEADMPAIRGGLATLLEFGLDYSAGSKTEADAALHIFEFSEGTRKKTVAVLIERDRFLASRNASQPDGIYGWELQSTLSDYLAEPKHLLVRVIDARERATDGDSNAYIGVAKELRDKIFSAPKRQSQIAESALRALQQLVNNSTRSPVILVRMLSVNNERLYLPLGLLSAKGPDSVFSKPITIVQPLPNERYVSTTTCVKPWTFGIPEKLENYHESLNIDPKVYAKMNPNWARTIKDLTDYLGASGSLTSPAEGFLLLAHHDVGYVWYNAAADRIAKEGLKRNFPVGSIAILSACATGAPTHDNRAILETLNGNGVDAVILSPIPIRADYGARLALDFAEVIRSNIENRKTPTVAEIFQQATEQTADYFARLGVLLGEASLEFVIAGDHRLHFCAE